jgi:S-phase kinase-associated protein 1
VKFTNTSQEVMFKTLLAANYMDIKPLLHLLCAKCASLMKGKTPDQIRATFNIRNDYTAEEEEMVRREHRDLIA